MLFRSAPFSHSRFRCRCAGFRSLESRLRITALRIACRHFWTSVCIHAHCSFCAPLSIKSRMLCHYAMLASILSLSFLACFVSMCSTLTCATVFLEVRSTYAMFANVLSLNFLALVVSLYASSFVFGVFSSSIASSLADSGACCGWSWTKRRRSVARSTSQTAVRPSNLQFVQ